MFSLLGLLVLHFAFPILKLKNGKDNYVADKFWNGGNDLLVPHFFKNAVNSLGKIHRHLFHLLTVTAVMSVKQKKKLKKI